MNRIMPRLLALAMLMALTLAALPAPAETAGAAAPLYLNAGSALTIYESADAASEPLQRQLLPGEKCELTASQSGWARIRVFTETGETEEGWVQAASLRPTSPADGYASAVIAPKNPEERPVLRAQPRSGGTSLGRYYPGVLARVLSQPDKGWVKLGIGSLEGYMQAEHLSFDPPPGSVADLLPRVSVAYKDGPSLTMRGAQSFKSEKIGAYRNGTEVKVLGFTDDFAQVLAPDGKLGFMMAWGLDPQPFAAAPAAPLPLPGTTPQPGVPAPAIQPPAAYAYITTVDNTRGQGAHLRKKSSQNSETQGMYPNGTQVYVLKYGEYWSRVWVDGKTGWMMTKLLQGTNEP